MGVRRASKLNLSSSINPRRISVATGSVLLESFEDWGASTTGQWTFGGSTGNGVYYGEQTDYATMGSKGGFIANEWSNAASANAFDSYVYRTFDLSAYYGFSLDVQVAQAQNGGQVYIKVGNTFVWSSSTLYATETVTVLNNSATAQIYIGAAIPSANNVRLARIKFDNLRAIY